MILLAPMDVEPETPEQRKARHFAMCREMAELGMELARDAVRAHPDDAGRTFARATGAVRQAIALEARVEAGTLGDARRGRPRAFTLAASPDRRRGPIREALHKAVASEPNPAARTAFRREIDERLEIELAADPDKPIDLVFCDLAEALGIALDPKNLPDELLGMPANLMPGTLHAPLYHPRE